jgi:hypothetical protein
MKIYHRILLLTKGRKPHPHIMKKHLILAACLLLMLFSCKQKDDFTGLWSKNYNPQYDAIAFSSWQKKGKIMVDTNVIKSPLFIRLKKEIGYYVMNCYQFDAARRWVVADPSIFDYIRFTKEDEYTLMSDNKASGLATDKRITIHVNPVTGSLAMNFPIDKVEMPADKKANALFHTMFESEYHKIMDIRRKAENADLIDAKLKDEHLILDR